VGVRRYLARGKSWEETTSRPLEGVLVALVEQAVAAPLCSCRLAEAGTRVIKIEGPEGDFARGYDRAALGQSSYFVWLNSGKEPVVLDVKDPDENRPLKVAPLAE
jgi:itaconate CoA-transferase